jgi:putative tryptophan/tyrosine transport system substrate-binding protein
MTTRPLSPLTMLLSRHTRRREVITLLGGAVAWPLAARAQQPAMPVVGYLGSTSPEMSAKRLAAFRKGLRDAGFEEGRNVAIEFRWADAREERMPELVADLVRRGVAVIVAPATTAGALAAKAATTTIPIVFAAGTDPVALGLVTSLSRPGGNVTGVTILGVELTAKRLGLLRELTPQATRFVALVNPRSVMADGIVKNVEASAPIFGLPVEILRASTDRELVAALSGLSQSTGAALLVTVDGFFFNRRALIVTLAARHALPAVYYSREYAEVGGLISYGANVENVLELTGIYTSRILKGEKPTDLPVAEPTKFELVVNLVTAKALGFDIPPTLIALADEVIE